MNVTYASRDLLHLNKVGEFHTWLKAQGYVDVPLKQYELIRMSHPLRATLIVWKRERAKEHATLTGESLKLYWEWKKSLEPDKLMGKHASVIIIDDVGKVPSMKELMFKSDVVQHFEQDPNKLPWED